MAAKVTALVLTVATGLTLLVVGFFTHHGVVAQTSSLPATVVIPADAPRSLTVAVERQSLLTTARVRLVSIHCTGEGVTAQRAERLPVIRGRMPQIREELALESGERTIQCVEIDPPAGAAGLPASPFEESEDSIVLMNIGFMSPKYPISAFGVAILGVVLMVAIARFGQRTPRRQSKNGSTDTANR